MLTMPVRHHWTEQTRLSFSLSLLDSHQPTCPQHHRSSAAKMLALPLHPFWWPLPDPPQTNSMYFNYHNQTITKPLEKITQHFTSCFNSPSINMIMPKVCYDI